MASDTNTKTLLHKVSGTLPAYAAQTLGRFNREAVGPRKKSYHPARMIFTITGVNLIPVLLLVFGFVMLGQYRTSLIASELELLQTQSELYVTILKNKYYYMKNHQRYFPERYPCTTIH